MCHLTKFLITDALPNDSAEEVAKFLVHKVVLPHGAPRTLISDRGKTFVSSMLANVNRLCNIEHRFTTPYHPQTNGLVERSHRTLADMLSRLVNYQHTDWDELLPFVTAAYNTATHEATKYTPFFLVHGREANSTFTAEFRAAPLPPFSYPDRLVTTVQKAREIAQRLADEAKRSNQERVDNKKTDTKFAVGDRAMLHVPLRQVGHSDKLQRQYFGPFTVRRRTGPVNVEIEPLPNARLPGPRAHTHVVHESRLKPFIEDPDNNGEQEPAPTQPENNTDDRRQPTGTSATNRTSNTNASGTQFHVNTPTDRARRHRRRPQWLNNFV